MNNVKNTIGWCDFTTNPIKGLCKGGCHYCYGKNIYKRFEKRFKKLYDMKSIDEVKFFPDEIDKTAKGKKPSRIFVCSTHDIMGSWIPDEWIEEIIYRAGGYEQHTFQFLTKYPERYDDWKFPVNCWLGVTDTGGGWYPVDAFSKIVGTEIIKFISFEPLLKPFKTYIYEDIDWVIIGAMTGAGSNKYQPQREWIKDILLKASRYNIPIFMKSNLKKVWKQKLIQEFPCTR